MIKSIKEIKKISYNIISKIFKYDELTVTTNDECILNKWCVDKEYKELPSYPCMDMISMNILELDSGNWDNGERHYILNKKKLIEYIKSFDEGTIHSLKKLIDPFVPYYREMIITQTLNE